MDRLRKKSKMPPIRRLAMLASAAFALISGSVMLANIDFSTHRVDGTSLSIETVQRGTMEIKVSANGQLLSKRIEQLAAQVPGRVARAEIKPGAVVHVGEVLVELANPQLIASAEEAQSAWDGAVAERQAAEAELQVSLMNQEVALTQVRFDTEKAKAKADADEALASAGLLSSVELRRSQLDLTQLKTTYDIETRRLQKLRDNIQMQLAVRKSRVTQLERALDRARAQTADLRVVAGIPGIVQAIHVEVGQQLQPGSPIGRIAQQDQLYAETKGGRRYPQRYRERDRQSR